MLLPDANVTWRHAPWAAKGARAFFRGVPSCGELRLEPGVCGRTWIARLAQARPDALDAGECLSAKAPGPAVQRAALFQPAHSVARGLKRLPWMRALE
jgi:hypothetical protein